MSDTPPGTKPTYGSAIRVAQIIHWLHGSPIGISQSELVNRLGISERTLARYIQTLRESFFDDDGQSLVEVTRSDIGGRLRFRRKGVKMEGSAYELMSLYLALDLMTFLEGTFLMDGVQDLLDRLQERLRKEHGHQTSLVLKDFHKKFFHRTEAPKDYSHLNDILTHVVKALVLQKQMDITYQTPGGEPKQHRIWPLSLLMYKRALYVVARRPSVEEGKTRDLTFAVERIKEVRVSDAGFNYPQDYEPSERFQNTFGLVRESDPQPVRLHFGVKVAQNVASRRWHQTQETTLRQDGTLEMTLTMDAGEEFIAWLLSYGHHVKVLEPEHLATRVREKLQQALDQY